MSGGAQARVFLLEQGASLDAAENVGVPAQLAELHIFRALLQRPPVAKAVSDLLLTLLFRGALDDRLRELVIMRIGWVTGCDYEWTQHWHIARERFGCSEAELLAVRDFPAAGDFEEEARAVLTATDEVLASGRVSPTTWETCRACFGDPVALELVTAIGTWRLISQLARSIELPLEAGVASWPPDGAAPGAE